MTVEDAAERLEVEPAHVRHLVRRKKLVRRGDSRPLLIDVASVESYRTSRREWRRYLVVGGLRAVRRLGIPEV